MADDLGALKEPANGLADRRSRDDQPQAAEPPAWRVLLAYARPYRLTLVVGGLLSLATGAVGLALPLTAKRLVDDLAQDRSVTEALVWLAVLGGAQVVTGVVVPRISRAASHAQESVGAMGTALERVLGVMRTVKASGAEQREAQRVDQAATQAWQAGCARPNGRRWPATPPGWPSRCRSSSCSAWGAPGSHRARSTWAP